MDREKLNKAALTNTEAAADLIADSRHLAANSFIGGANWLMQQPLSERMTDEEKEKTNALQGEIFKEIMNAHDADDWQSVAHYIMDVMPRTFASIFGADLFKDK